MTSEELGIMMIRFDQVDEQCKRLEERIRVQEHLIANLFQVDKRLASIVARLDMLKFP